MAEAMRDARGAAMQPSAPALAIGGDRGARRARMLIALRYFERFLEEVGAHDEGDGARGRRRHRDG